MIIIDKDYCVDVDTLNYTAKIDLHKTDKKGNTTYKIIGYYGTLKNAVKGVYEYKAKKALSDGQHTLKQSIDVLRELEKELHKTLEILEVK